MTHPTPPRPSQPPPPPRAVDADLVLDEADRILAGPLPRLGEVIRDAERLGAQMIAVLGRQYDPQSAPDEDVWPGGMPVADYFLAVAVSSIRTGLSALTHLAELSPPPVGSAIKFPARQDLEAFGPASPVATPDGPVGPPDLDPGKEPTPGSAAAAGTAACESDGGLTRPVAGASSGPSLIRSLGAHRPERGAGPGYLGAAQP